VQNCIEYFGFELRYQVMLSVHGRISVPGENSVIIYFVSTKLPKQLNSVLFYVCCYTVKRRVTLKNEWIINASFSNKAIICSKRDRMDKPFSYLYNWKNHARSLGSSSSCPTLKRVTTCKKNNIILVEHCVRPVLIASSCNNKLNTVTQ
jgi:hypothetical protein